MSHYIFNVFSNIFIICIWFPLFVESHWILRFEEFRFQVNLRWYSHWFPLIWFPSQVISSVPVDSLFRTERPPTKEIMRYFIRHYALRLGMGESAPWVVEDELVKKFNLPSKFSDFLLDPQKVTCFLVVCCCLVCLILLDLCFFFWCLMSTFIHLCVFSFWLKIRPLSGRVSRLLRLKPVKSSRPQTPRVRSQEMRRERRRRKRKKRPSPCPSVQLSGDTCR